MAIVTPQEASSSNFRYEYQVFLSFRGEDTPKTFIDHLYTALVQAGVCTLRYNDETERGKKLGLELERAVNELRISIIVFSTHYAYSKWCLDEVLKILEWSGIAGHEVLPIFYDVDPSDVRKQRGEIGEAFSLHEKNIMDAEMDQEIKEKEMDKLKSWRVALEEVANISGMVFKNEAEGHEAKFIEHIVSEIKHKLKKKFLDVGTYLVGMEGRIRIIDSWVKNILSSEDILVISGMGGIGKTTIAKHIYNLNFQQFEGSSFLASVKDESERPRGLLDLQMQLLSSILKGKIEEPYNLDEGIIMIKETICCKRVLLVIDDVDDVKQLDALLGTREFAEGSKIIITTRNKSLLKAHEAHKLHEVKELSYKESIELFCLHAFGNEKPNEGYEEVSERAINHCVGLPLAHKIIGSAFAEKSKKMCERMLDKLDATPDPTIINVLKISIISLESTHDRNLFLDIACFFVGHDKNDTITILDACNYFTECGIQILLDRYILSVDLDNRLVMNHFFREIAWQIVDDESPNELGIRSRSWRPMDSLRVLKENKGTERIEGLVFDMHRFENDALTIKRKGMKPSYDEFCDIIFPPNQSTSFIRHFFKCLSSEPSVEPAGVKYEAFTKMDNLRLLTLNYIKLSGCPKNFPEGLIFLRCHGFPSKSIPYDLPLEKLVYLDMRYSKLEHVWTRNKVLLSLKILDLSHSKKLIRTPNFKGLPNLEKLILEGCDSLVHICDTIGSLKRLSLLNLKDCKSLRKYPNIRMLNSLQWLVFDGCSFRN